MTVLLSNCSLGLRRREDAETRNEHGERVQTDWGDPVSVDGETMLDGRRNEQTDGTWSLAVDPGLWPVRQGDAVVSSDGMVWVVTTSDLIQNAYDSIVDWVRVTAQQVSDGGTEPADAWFVGRGGTP